MSIYFQKSTSRLITILIILSTSLSILFFYFTNEVTESKDRLDVQALNMTLFLSQHNIIMTTPELLPASFLRASYENYSLAAYGAIPNINEIIKTIETKSDYLQKFDETQGSIVDKVNAARDALTKDKDTLTKFYYITFIILIFVQSILLIISVNIIKMDHFHLNSIFVFILLILLFFLTLGWVMGSKWIKDSWFYIISSVTAILTLAFVYAQYKHNQIISQFTTLPSVGFSLMSGQTFFKKQKKNLESINDADKGDTRIIVDNKSKFPISFWITINNEQGTEALFELGPWRINPGTLFFAHQPDLIEKVLKIGSNVICTKISYAPLHNEKLKQFLPSERWTFKKDSNEWEDCHQARDSNNMTYDKILEEMGKS